VSLYYRGVPTRRNHRVKSVRIRLVSLVALSLSALTLIAAPAGAATPVVVANEKFKWFYWIGVILVVSFVGWLISTAVGYYLRVLRPKLRGRQPS
jgi:drug/metabolite transporter (DMT)-like permease